MNTEIYRTLKINARNVRWNTYEYITKISFWGGKTSYIRVKDKYGVYAKEEYRVVGDDWRILEYEIGLINWILKEKISRNDLDTIKSPNFIDLCKEYQNKDSIYVYVNIMLGHPTQTQMLIKKRWALELWAAYQNNYHLNGIRTFKISDGTTIEYVQSIGCVGLNINGTYYSPRKVDAYFWKWLEEYNIVY